MLEARIHSRRVWRVKKLHLTKKKEKKVCILPFEGSVYTNIEHHAIL